MEKDQVPEGIELFFMSDHDIVDANWHDGQKYYESGWYWWVCQVGCLPDSDSYGPFQSEQAALNDIKDWEEN